MEKTHVTKMSSKRPGLILILIDQSGSMGEAYEGEKKSSFAATAVNRVIYELIRANQSGEDIKNRCEIRVVGYGATVSVLVTGLIGDIAKKPLGVDKLTRKMPDGAGGLVEVPWEMPVWVRPASSNGTPMAEALDLAYSEVNAWLPNHTSSFPPIVINITDGQPNDAASALEAAKRLTQLCTDDGKLLLLNAHIQQGAAGEIALPGGENTLTDEFARFLFQISSELPETTLDNARIAGFTPGAGARGFVYKAGAETLIKLLSFGSTIGEIRGESSGER